VLGDIGKRLGADEVGDHRDPRGHLIGRDPDIDRDGKVAGQGRQRALQPLLGEHARMQPVCKPAQLLEGLHKLVLGTGDLVAGPFIGGRPSAAAQGRRQLCEPGLGAVVQATLQPPAFLVACRKDPSTRCRELLHPGLHLGLEAGIGAGELRR
jgi:hypothetical protein